MDPAINHESIVKQLNKILSSAQFAGAFRIRELLKFLVEQTLAGRTDQIKAYTIALEVFDRGADFDPQSDPIVRITAGRLRRHLDDYYENCGPQDAIRITIPKGTYVPKISYLRLPPEELSDSGNDSRETLFECDIGPGKSALDYTEPVIAVLPFTDLSKVKTPDYLLNGLSDELSTLLALFEDIRVVDYYSMAKLRGQSIGVREVGRQLGANFLISGSIKIENDSIKIRASLSETKNAIQIWTHIFDRSLSGENIANTLSDIVGRIISALAGEFGAIFRQRSISIQKRAQADLTHYEAIFMHRHSQLTGINTYSRHLLDALNRAVELNPEFALGWATLGEMHLDRQALEYSSSKRYLDKGYSFAQKAIQLDPLNQYANYVLAYSHILRRDPDNVIPASERVLSLNPHAAYLVGGAAFWLCLAGEFERGLPLINRSIRLNPYYPKWFHHAPFLFHLKRNDYQKALEEADRFHIPEFYWSFIDKTVATGLLGDKEAAKANLTNLVKLLPDFVKHPGYYVRAFVVESDLLEKMLEGLAKAGLQTMQ